MMKSSSLAAGIVFFLILFAGSQSALAARKIVVGYQAYSTEYYSCQVIKAKELWKKYMPKDTEVQFENALQGSVIVNALVAGKQDIGYLGDMPSVIATTKQGIAPIKLVANTAFSAGQYCNILMVRSDAPQFKNYEEAVKWLEGKAVATPKGSCAERFLRIVMEKTGVRPAQILNQSLEVIATNFRVKKIDAAVLWEPTVSRIGDLVGDGIARIVTTGYDFNADDAGFLAMRSDFVEKHPDLAYGWLQAELDAQLWILDPENWAEMADIVSTNAMGITPKIAKFAEFGLIPAQCGGAPERDTKPFVFTEPVMRLLDGTYTFLHQNKIITVDKAPAGSIDDSIARKILAERGITAPIGVIPPKGCPGVKD